MITFNQKTDPYRPLNRIKEVQQVDIVKTLENFTLDDIIEKIQKLVKQKNIRISEFMRDFDKLRSGTITNTQFLSSLSMHKIFLTQKEAELLIAKYKSEEKENFVQWKVFCEDIDKVFIIKNLEKREDINELEDITKTSFKLNELSLPDQAVLQEILTDMKAFNEINRIDPKPQFTNYDHLKRGKVLKPQFKKILHSMKFMIKDADIDILMKKYGDQISNEINYVVILNDAKDAGEKNIKTDEVKREEEQKEIIPVLSSANNFYTYQTHFLNLDFNIKDIIDKIKHRVKINRIRLNEFFQDFDGLRKGVCTKAKMRTALDMANLSLRSEEYVVLEKCFEVEGDPLRVNYKVLVDEVDTVFTLKELEKDPLLRPEEFKIPDFLDPEKRLSQSDNLLLNDVMIKLAVLMRKYRVHPKAYFKDADKAKIGIIPSSKFASILNFLRLDVLEKEMNILIKRFYGKNMIEINYFDFDNILQKYCEVVNRE